jgi:hypothetical protein
MITGSAFKVFQSFKPRTCHDDAAVIAHSTT